MDQRWPSKKVTDTVLEAAQMVVTEGLGEGVSAHGFFIVVGDAKEILSGERADPESVDSRLCNYGRFQTYLDRRSDNLKIGECLGSRKRIFLYLFHDDGAIVVDGQTGQVCCGGFFLHDIASGVSSGGARTQAASAMATQAGSCYVVLASQTICGSVEKPIPPKAALKLFNHTREPQDFPVQVSETAVREQSFEQWLHPLKFGGDLLQYNRDFVDGTRQWVLDDLEAWRCDSNGSPCRVLLAGPGFGKTTIAARLYQMTTRMLAIHLCRHNDRFKRDPRRMIASMAYQIADVLPQFRDALRKVRHAEGGASDAYSLRSTARELADCLLFDPLSSIEPPEPIPQGGRYVIIMDALDEAEHDAKNDLLDLVAFDFRKLPPWVAVLVTARPEVDVSRTLAPLRPTLLDAEANRDKCDFDVRIYLRRILAPRFSDEGSLTRAIDETAKKAEGLFLYLYYMRDMLAHGDNDLDALPIGLPGVYQKELVRVLGPDGVGDEDSPTRCVVDAIIAAQVPVHVSDELPGLSGVPEGLAIELVAKLSRLLPVRDNRVYIFHKTFADWLTREKCSFDKQEFIVDRCAAHRRLASACSVPLMRVLSEGAKHFESDANAVNALKRLVEARSFVADDSQQSPAIGEYSLTWCVTHLVEAGGLEDVSLALLHSLRFLMRRALQIDTLIADAALLLPKTALLHRALIRARYQVQLVGAQWLAEELWQRLHGPAQARDIVDLKRLTRDARLKARSDLMFSSRRAYLPPADSPLHCALMGHSAGVSGVTTFADAKGQTWVASCSDDATVRIWDPTKGGEAIHVLAGHGSTVNSVTTFVDAKGHPLVASCSNDKTVRIWDPIKGESVHVLEGHCGRVIEVKAFLDAQGHRRIASCSTDKTVRIWDPIKGGQAVHVLEGHSEEAAHVTAFVDAKGHPWVASCSGKTVYIWDPMRGGEAVHVLKGHSGEVKGLTAFVDAKGHPWVASCSQDKTVRIWDPTKGREAVYVLEGHSENVEGVTAFVDAKGHPWVASCASDETVRIWDPMKGGNAVHVLKGHSGSVNGMAAFVDAKGHPWLASFYYGKVLIWDPIKGGGAVHVLEGHFSVVVGVATFVDAKGYTWVASCSWDHTVNIWALINGGGEAVSVPEGHPALVEGVTSFVDAKGHSWVASCSVDSTVRIWDPVMGGQAVHVLEGHSANVEGVTAFVDAKGHTWVVSCSRDQTVRIWDPLKRREAVYVLWGHSDWVTGVMTFVDHKGRPYVASCSRDSQVRVWDPTRECEAIQVLVGHEDAVNGVTAFVDAKGQARVASCSYDKTVRIWDPIRGGEAINVLKGHSSWINGVMAFVDAKGHTRVASCSWDKTVRIWDPIKGGEAVHVLQGHSADVVGVTALVDAKGHRWVASCSEDKTVRIWDSTNFGKAIYVIPLESRPTAIAAISPSSSRNPGSDQACLVIGHRNGRISYWEHLLHDEDEHVMPHRHTRQELSCQHYQNGCFNCLPRFFSGNFPCPLNKIGK